MIMARTALVTGGASGLGAAIAARLRAVGLAVTTLDVSGPADVVADVTDEAALRRIAGEIGPVDVLINSAGIIGANKTLLETTAEEWRRAFDVNVLGTVNTMRTFVPGMCERGWGRVVNFASMALCASSRSTICRPRRQVRSSATLASGSMRLAGTLLHSCTCTATARAPRAAPRQPASAASLAVDNRGRR